MSRRLYLASRLLLLLLLATGLRFYRLDAQSFWNDEGNAARAAERTVPLILAAAGGDIHPPGYYLLLHYWRMPMGDSEFALRALSALCGVLTVAVVYALGRDLLGEQAGLGAALLLALSPFSVYYSQEARMYALLGLLSALSTYLLVRLARRPTLPLSIGYVLSAGGGLYTHYAFPSVLLVHNLLFLGWWLTKGRQGWRYLAGWVGLQAAVLLLFLPWLPTAVRSVTTWPSAERDYRIGDALVDVFRALAAGITLEATAARRGLILAGGLLIAGLWPQRGRIGPVATLILWLLLPIGLIFALDLYKPTYLKFLLTALPPFCLLLAHGVERLSYLAFRAVETGGRISGLKLQVPRLTFDVSRLTLYALLFTTTFLPSLHNLYFDPAYARDDYRQIAADIRTAERPGDGILLDAPNQWEVFTYYYRDGVPVYPIPRQRPPRAEEVYAELEGIAASHRRLFVLYWGDVEADPERLVEGWLATHAYPAGSRWYGNVRVVTYGLAPLPEEPAVRLDARFGEAIRLLGYGVGEGPFAPGEVIPVTLFWEADGPVPERYKVFLHLLDGAGNLVAQRDAEPMGDLLPTPAWSPGQRIIDRHGVLLPEDLPAGEYTLSVGLYHIDTGQRLPIVVGGEIVGDSLALGNILVRP
ncbi:MAG TPA: hypothetical protein G4O00_07635 [Thermoflexia bacterium]|nr:hypothetical protein [Thermoflexia bacterium]